MKSIAKIALYQQKMIPKTFLVLYDRNKHRDTEVIEINNDVYTDITGCFDYTEVPIESCSVGLQIKANDEHPPETILLLT